MIDEYMRGREDQFEELVEFIAWLDAQIEAARQDIFCPVAVRTTLERVKARLERW